MVNSNNKDDKYLQMLISIDKFEKENPDSLKTGVGWEWTEVNISPVSLNTLMLKGYITRVYDSNNHKGYILTEDGKQAASDYAAKLDSVNDSADSGIVSEPAVIPLNPDELFSDIVGYEDVKVLIRESMQLEKPIHVLLQGPPSVAKSMFLSDIEKATGSQSLWLLGSATSKAGLWEAILDQRPRYILIDELDKASGTDMASLLSLMQNQRLTRIKANKRIDIPITCWVFASANRIDKVTPELLSRFKVKRLSEYNSLEYALVIRNVLVNQEGLSSEIATDIAKRLYGKTHDVRDAVRVGRLSSRLGVERAVQILID
jgi:Holliday junction DNA helicase RuvB